LATDLFYPVPAVMYSLMVTEIESKINSFS